MNTTSGFVFIDNLSLVNGSHFPSFLLVYLLSDYEFRLLGVVFACFVCAVPRIKCRGAVPLTYMPSTLYYILRLGITKLLRLGL